MNISQHLYCMNIFSLNCSFCFNQCWLSLISKIDITVGRILNNVKWTSMLNFNFLFNFLMIRGTSNTNNHGKTNILEFFIHVLWLIVRPLFHLIFALIWPLFLVRFMLRFMVKLSSFDSYCAYCILSSFQEKSSGFDGKEDFKSNFKED